MERTQFERVPLGRNHKAVRISAAEMHLAYLHRAQTGEPIQTWIRRLIRENARASASEQLPRAGAGSVTDPNILIQSETARDP